MKLVNAFFTILIIDPIYKINMNKFSLLKIVNITSTKMTYSIYSMNFECEEEDNVI